MYKGQGIKSRLRRQDDCDAKELITYCPTWNFFIIGAVSYGIWTVVHATVFTDLFRGRYIFSIFGSGL